MSKRAKEINIPIPEFYKSKFRYDAIKDVHICPGGAELIFKNKAVHHSKVMKLYKSNECLSYPFKVKCTRNPRGRIIYRWEHKEILEDMRERIRLDREKVRKRQWMTEHIFGTMKRNFNIKRVIKIIGLKELIAQLLVKRDRVFNYVQNIHIKLLKIIIEGLKVICHALLYNNSFNFSHNLT